MAEREGCGFAFPRHVCVWIALEGTIIGTNDDGPDDCGAWRNMLVGRLSTRRMSKLRTLGDPKFEVSNFPQRLAGERGLVHGQTDEVKKVGT